MPPRPLTNFEIQKHCQNIPKFNSVYSIKVSMKYRMEHM